MFALSDLLLYDDFTIQCHDNPDADALASAFGVYTYVSSFGKTAKIIYGGRFAMTKPNLLEMTQSLSIQAEFIDAKQGNLPSYKTLVVVDGQYGTGNVTRFPAETVAVIDHHKEEKTDFDLGVISQLGSCSTLIWDLLRKENFPLASYPDLSTALYYGLFTDTNSLSEISHPLDKDARDVLHFNRIIIRKLQNTNLSLKELDIAAESLATYTNNHDLRYCIFRAAPCDPNILGFISDLALQVDIIDACVVFNTTFDGAKLSVRSCTREIMASDLAAFLTAGVGSGGGHIHKAGGFMQKAKVDETGMTFEEFIDRRTREYFDSYDIIDSASHTLDVAAMPRYLKKKIPVGYVLSTDVVDKGTPILVRSLEGDAETFASDDIYIMVGILGEVYPIKSAKFYTSYEKTEEEPNKNYEYSPTVHNRITGEITELSPYIKPCAALGAVTIHARPIDRLTKVFTSWNTETYMLGKPGDFVAVREEDWNDVYIIRGDIFYQTYEAV